MNWREYKIEILIIGVTSLMLVLFLAMSRTAEHSRTSDLEEIVYEMPRPKSSFAYEFDLSNREILRNFFKRFVKNKHNPLAEGKVPNVAPRKPAAKPNPKKSAAKASPLKKSRLKVSVVDRDHSPKSSSGDDMEDFEAFEPFIGPQDPPPQVSQKTPKGPLKKRAKPIETDWKSLFATRPTRELMVSFIKAYRAKEVADDVYYETLKDLAVSHNEQKETLALYGLRSTISTRSFAEASHWTQDPEIQKNPAFEEKIQNYLMSFNQKDRMEYLDESLKSKDTLIALRATQVIGEGFTRVRAGEFYGSGRSQRDLVTASANSDSYRKFLPNLELLSQSSEPEVARAALALMEQLQTTRLAQIP